MKSSYNILFIIGVLIGCGSPQFVTAPVGTVPKRNKIETDVFGGYVTIKTIDARTLSGELIGIRNDTVVVLGDTILTVERKQIETARVIVHMPNDYKVSGFVLMGLSSLVVFQTGGGYGAAPLVMALSGILSNSIGLASAQGTEERKINYYDWSEGWEKVILYSRFPSGIPPSLKLSLLKKQTEN